MSFPVVGVTGSPCSGKSYAARLLVSGAAPGLPAGELLQADAIGHEVLLWPEVVRELRGRFGDAPFASPDPAAVRRAIADAVFGAPEELAWLEGVVHPRVVAAIDRAVAAHREARPVVIEAALLFAGGLDRRCDRVLLIEADFAVRLERARARGWDRAELERRERRQTPLFDAAKTGPARERVIVVANNTDGDALLERLRQAVAECEWR